MNFAFITRSLRNLSWPRRRFSPHLVLGWRGERAAVSYLKRRGHRIIARNYRCPAGEIDLIATRDDTLIFLEVKTRASCEAEDAHEALRSHQRGRIEHAARYFLRARNVGNCPCRFDLITVIWPARGGPLIEHFEDAFRPRRA